jgi:hypothetical protein
MADTLNNFSGPMMGDFQPATLDNAPLNDRTAPITQQPVPPVPSTNNIPAVSPKTANTPQPPPVHPAVQKASMGANIVKGIADVLSPPQYKTEINPDGSTKQTPIPRTRKDVGMSIALAALSGAFSGLGQVGPGHLGRAAAAGFNTTMQQRQQADQQQSQQAQADFARKQATVSFNMQQMNAALDLGTKDKSYHEDYVQSYDHLVKQWSELPNVADIIKFGSPDAPLSEDEAEDIKKHSVFELMRVPVSTYERRDPKTGKQVWVNNKGEVVPEGSYSAHPAWDNGYILVDKNAPAKLSDENGPTQTVKDLVAKYDGIIPGVNKSLLAGKGVQEPIPATSYGQMLFKANTIKSAQDTVNNFVNTLNEGESEKNQIKPVDLVDAIKNNKITLNDLDLFQRAIGKSSQANATSLQTKLDAVSAKNQAAGARLVGFFDSLTPTGEGLKTFDQKIQAQGKAYVAKLEQESKAMTPDEAESIQAKAVAGQHVDPHDLAVANEFTRIHTANIVNKDKQVEQGKQDLADQQNRKVLAYTETPPGWGLQQAQTAASMRDPFAIEEYLKKNNVPNVPYLHDLISISQYRDSLDEFTKRLTKGTGQMDEATAATFINKFLNPGFTKEKFREGSAWFQELGQTKPGTAGGTIMAAGTAARHLDHYGPLLEAVNNGDVQLYNKLLTNLAQQTGSTPIVQAQIVANALSAETEKVITGSTPLESRMKDASQGLNPKALSKDQGFGAIKTLSGLMNDRLNELNDKNMALYGTPLNLISPHTTQFMKKLGFETSWDQKSEQQRQQETNQQKQQKLQAITLPGGGHPVDIKYKGNTTIVSDGHQWIDLATGKPYVAQK